MIKCNCDECGKEFFKSKSDYKKCKLHFCSRTCYALHEKKESIQKGKFINCKVCNKEIFVKPFQFETKKFCSKACFNKGKTSNIWNKGLTKYTDPRLMNVSKKTSEQLKREYESGVRDKFEIGVKAREVCAKKMQEDNWLLHPENRKKLKETQQTPEFKLKSSLAKMGAKNGMYGKEGWSRLPVEREWWKDEEYLALRIQVLNRDGNKCVVCGKLGDNESLYCDHIIPYRTCNEHKIDNLQTLCGSCHSKKTMREIKEFKKNLNLIKNA